MSEQFAMEVEGRRTQSLDPLLQQVLTHAKMAHAPLPEVNLPRIRTRADAKSGRLSCIWSRVFNKLRISLKHANVVQGKAKSQEKQRLKHKQQSVSRK